MKCSFLHDISVLISNEDAYMFSEFSVMYYFINSYQSMTDHC